MFSLNPHWILFCAVQCAQSHTVDPPNRHPNPVFYKRAQVWRTNLRNADDILLIKRLMDNENVSMWKLTPKQADFLVRCDMKLHVNRQLKARDLNHTVLIMDVQRRIDAQTVEPDKWDKNSLRREHDKDKYAVVKLSLALEFSKYAIQACQNRHHYKCKQNTLFIDTKDDLKKFCYVVLNSCHRMNWNKYPTLEIINEYLNFLTKNYPSICKQEVIGRTFENNTITMMKVSNGNPSNKAIILNAGSHAREWIAITSALVILREIVTNYDEQPSYMKDKDWYIIPLLNPDGFMYTQKTNRLWRKNRRRSKICYGVDINRNFNVSWYVKGISQTSECKNTYIGPHPFSEKESIALRDTVLKLKGRLNAVLDLHSYGQIVLHPWSGKSEPTDHKAIHNATAAGISRALYQHKKSKYKYGHTYHVIYPATGSALDWVYANGVVHSYVIEGPDKGYHGFLMPPEQIERTGMEMLAAVKYLADVLKDRETGEEKRSSWF